MRLQINILLKKQSDHLINHQSNILLLGSCFSDNMGEKLNYFKFKSTVNPFGILFNPIAIENFITRALNISYYTKEDLCFNNELWCCLDAHSVFNTTSEAIILNELNTALTKTQKHIKETSHVIITLGTSWVYRHIALDKTVANCHKIPQKEFKKELLSVKTIVQSLTHITDLISKTHPNTTFIFTVSPVRHLKDGFVENTQSKAHLITAIHQFLNHNSEIKNKRCFYFPSYEIMLDELRDYRFYKPDMIHPSIVAIDYIWDKFSTNWISESSLDLMEKIDAIQKRKAHKAYNPNSEAHKKFLHQLKLDIEELKIHLPKVNFHL